MSQTPIEQARIAAADHYLGAAEAELTRPGCSHTTAMHLRKTATRILSGTGDHHPMVVAHLAVSA